MDLGIRGKNALVTASSKGIGKAVAMRLAEEGCSVAICARSRSSLDSAEKDLKAFGGKVLALEADITNPGDIEKMFSRATEEFGGVDILVTNAGGPPPGPFTSLSDQDWEKAVELNLMSVVRLMRGALPGMKERGWGRIVNLASVSVKEPVDNLLLSNAIRPGVVGLSKTISREVAGYNITINCVAPGYTATERLKELASSLGEKRGEGYDEVVMGWTNNIPLGRLGKPEEIAAVVAF
ncbi:MAG: SDR family oxidoreductase, partial [Candidatus Thermoplasmatota archaeon]|nr:SDR family oxidoreductase [Candidatus Thermoplasmatota archaeon]